VAELDDAGVARVPDPGPIAQGWHDEDAPRIGPAADWFGPIGRPRPAAPIEPDEERDARRRAYQDRQRRRAARLMDRWIETTYAPGGHSFTERSGMAGERFVEAVGDYVLARLGPTAATDCPSAFDDEIAAEHRAETAYRLGLVPPEVTAMVARRRYAESQHKRDYGACTCPPPYGRSVGPDPECPVHTIKPHYGVYPDPPDDWDQGDPWPYGPVAPDNNHGRLCQCVACAPSLYGSQHKSAYDALGLDREAIINHGPDDE
jgi:hypothetical protein